MFSRLITFCISLIAATSAQEFEISLLDQDKPLIPVLAPTAATLQITPSSTLSSQANSIITTITPTPTQLFSNRPTSPTDEITSTILRIPNGKCGGHHAHPQSTTTTNAQTPTTIPQPTSSVSSGNDQLTTKITSTMFTYSIPILKPRTYSTTTKVTGTSVPATGANVPIYPVIAPQAITSTVSPLPAPTNN